MSKKLLVTGASGKLGQLVLENLIKRGEKNIIATSRKIEKLAAFATKGVDVRSADFEKTETLDAAFKGAERLLIISTDAIGSRVEQHKNAIAAAKKAGVRHIVYTSWPKADTSVAFVSKEHIETEKLIKESGLTYTILRNYPYAQNIFYAIPQALEMGTLYGTAGKGGVAYVTREDCAEAAAGALIQKNEKNEIYDISGKDVIDYEELVKLVSEVSGKPLKYVDIPEADLKAALLKSGLPEIWADVFVTFDLSYKNGDTKTATDAVLKLSGHEPKGFKEFLIENKAALFSAQAH
ncbi:SDR family NAD(P)-dependent oxidoreductase [Bacteriovorax stolpii]|uniref:NAD(P)-dependent oxidoreductase n=1 Tax=Bacteriovorax stolpii TaxID=960 RepID=A0A2K9NUW7_BACTC|nr:SDR family oxidoreductase [Bacteriovorax stolpii]AUN98885.1 NAD(P)-dependent oxidoreductase [Bacteriovorax stolpii]QDK41120.1 SDR family NAD(P)-dependent oxidoreductase [Bacteriovorax stolpii]TDP55594.1 NAD(P)H dehydrogenase (quinone) [Bacteriovorax stolpii]